MSLCLPPDRTWRFFILYGCLASVVSCSVFFLIFTDNILYITVLWTFVGSCFKSIESFNRQNMKRHLLSLQALCLTVTSIFSRGMQACKRQVLDQRFVQVGQEGCTNRPEEGEAADCDREWPTSCNGVQN